MLFDKKVHNVFLERYKLKKGAEPIPRNGIKCSDHEVIVELFPRKMRLVVIPNKSVFNFTTPMYIFVSRNDTMKLLNLKV